MIKLIYRALNAARVWMVLHGFPAQAIRPVSRACVAAYYRKEYGRRVHAD